MILFDHMGKAVRLPDERLDHFAYRVVYAGLQYKLQETLLNPDLVVRSNWDEAGNEFLSEFFPFLSRYSSLF